MCFGDFKMTEGLTDDLAEIGHTSSQASTTSGSSGSGGPRRSGLGACLRKFGTPTPCPNTQLSVNVQDFDALGKDGSNAEDEFEIIQQGDNTEWPEGVTTVMIRNIACRFTSDNVSQELQVLGLGGKFSTICVPRSRMGHSNLGYAFVNFWSDEYAKACKSLCHGRVFGQSYTTKMCEVVPARIQGAARSAWGDRKRLNAAGNKVQKVPRPAKNKRAPAMNKMPQFPHMEALARPLVPPGFPMGVYGDAPGFERGFSNNNSLAQAVAELQVAQARCEFETLVAMSLAGGLGRQEAPTRGLAGLSGGYPFLKGPTLDYYC